jgi:diaminohydroxyphosphoribosylaminopyrimidine deaminase/5-amino-6-(5-phosphoribosylamino)uracil reductase
MKDKIFMQRALELAEKGKGRTSPNPAVGAVIVKGNKIIAEGRHKKAGTAHAEVIALRKAGRRARGATLYINLEPCSHTDKKTPPCTQSIIRSGIKRVVAAMIDPNPRVSGRGMRELKNAGIDTEIGIMMDEARKLNEPFIKFITTGEPFVILKIAQSLDGKIATSKGDSRWITGVKAREYVHMIRNEVDAVLVGIGTVMKDNPLLDCRAKKGRNPYRVIVDSGLRIPLNAKILKHEDRKTIIATTLKADKKKIDCLINRGNRVLIIKDGSGRIKPTIKKTVSRRIYNGVNLSGLMKDLGNLGITSVLIEGGSSINASALSCGIVDKIMVFIAPKIIGGADSISSVGGESLAFLMNAIIIKDLSAKKIGEDILIEAYPYKS